MPGVSSTDRYIWPLVSKERIAAEGPVVLSEGEGSRVTDTDGKTYLELSSGITRASSLGYGNTEIADAVHAQLRKLHYAGTAEYQADVVFELAEKLAELTPGDLGPCYFTESGTASNEAAFKLARFYHAGERQAARLQGDLALERLPRRDRDPDGGQRLARGAACPGSRTPPASPSSRARPVTARPSGSRGAACDHPVPRPLEQQILHEGPELVSAVIAEPVMQANGVQIPPPDYFPGVREICDRHDVIFIADEVITGFGRTGKWFAIEHWGVQPDMITMAKALTAGYMPARGGDRPRGDLGRARGLPRRPHLRRPRRWRPSPR